MSCRSACSVISRGLAVALGIYLLAGLAGCATGLRPRSVAPVPVYKYPDLGSPGNLVLVSVFSDPRGASFYQGPRKAAGSERLLQPFAAAMTPQGVFYILDHGAGRVLRLVYDGKGVLTDLEYLDHGSERFPSAVDLEVLPDGGVWVSDSALGVVSRFDARGKYLGDSEGFERPVGLAFDKDLNRMIVADIARSSLDFLNRDGSRESSWNRETGLVLDTPSYLAVSPGGLVCVTEALAARVTCLGPEGRPEQVIGGAGDGPGFFAKPKGVAVDSQGRIYVVDTLFDVIQIFAPDGKLLLALGESGSGVGEFWQPQGISIDDQGRIYIADTHNNRIQVYAWEKEEGS